MNIRAIIWGLIIGSLLLMIALPTVLLLGFGMLPTIVAYLIDRNEEKFATFCVGGLNFCGVFPYLLNLWGGEHTNEASIGILTDVFAIAVMYGGAGIGWLLYLTLPPVVSSFIQVMNKRRLEQLRQTQREIVEEWGEEVTEDALEGMESLMPPDMEDEDEEEAADGTAPPVAAS